VEEKNVDVAIIGSGSAGLYALSQVRRTDRSFVLINGGEPGTTCARVGCMPSKAMIQVAEDIHRRMVYNRYGIAGHEDIRIDLPEAMEYVRDLRDTFVDRVLSSSTDELGEEFVEGYARFLEPDLLEVEGQRIRASRIIIATGSSPVVPEEWRGFGERIVTTDTLFEQEALPETMAVIGLGVIGLEMGQSLHRMGIGVTGIDAFEGIGGLQDPEVSKAAVDALGKEFPIWLGHVPEIVEEGAKLRVTAGEHSVVVDKVLCSIGRRPNVDNLGLENIGIELDERGIPVHDRNTMQVGGHPIFIAGDVTGERMVLHEAGDEGRIAGYNAAQGEVAAFRRKVPLTINFCDPNICTVGRRWSELDQESTAVGEMMFGPVGRALIMAKNKGLLRVYADKHTGRLLGAEMVAPKGENLAHLLAWTIQQGLTVGDLLRMPFYHPVIEEALQAALNDLYRKVEAKNQGGLTELERLS
jgi:dihydrolipoamide dehydrogenase